MIPFLLISTLFLQGPQVQRPSVTVPDIAAQLGQCVTYQNKLEPYVQQLEQDHKNLLIQIDGLQKQLEEANKQLEALKPKVKLDTK